MEDNNVMENQDYAVDENLDLAPMDGEIIEDDGSGLSSLLITGGKVLLMGYGAVKLGEKAAQKIYTAAQEKKNKPVLCREKFYQVWRPKGISCCKEQLEVIEGNAVETTENVEPNK